MRFLGGYDDGNGVPGRSITFGFLSAEGAISHGVKRSPTVNRKGFAIEGLSDGNEFARVDSLTLLPRNVFDVDSDPIAAVSETGTIM